MRNERERLLDILEAIERIEKYAILGQQAFEQSELIQTWILHHLQIIGEAARTLPNDLKQQHPEIPWPKISGMRNILVHHYFEIDEAIVWAVIERDLPDIKSAVTTILPTMPDTPNSRAMPDAS